ncbi:MAG: glycerophosphodiester phosphodiesterase [Acidimicrobiales bacterium]
MAPRFAFLDHPGPIPFAHRGGAGAWPENTMPAFQGAVDLGYRYLETDVHLTADGVLVAFHDDRLDRVTDLVGVISELPYASVARARVDGREPIPLFEDLLTSFPDIRINVDPKNDNTVEPLAAMLLKHNAIDRVCVGAFSDKRLDRMRALCGPELCTSMGPRRVGRLLAATTPGTRRVGRPPSFVEGAAQVPTHQKGVPLVTSSFVEGAHRLGVQVHVWTIDDPAEMRRLLDLGVDGIMTDQPIVLKDVLTERGQWVG